MSFCGFLPLYSLCPFFPCHVVCCLAGSLVFWVDTIDHNQQKNYLFKKKIEELLTAWQNRNEKYKAGQRKEDEFLFFIVWKIVSLLFFLNGNIYGLGKLFFFGSWVGLLGLVLFHSSKIYRDIYMYIWWV